ncbi:DNA-binding protein [Photobacterium damselae]
MARKGITKDQVFNAANAIKARGLEPTITLVRAEIGEGSFSTISQHLSNWKSQDAEVVDASEMPPQAEEAVLQACATIWNLCQKESKKEVKAVKQEAADTVKMVKDDLEMATKENEELTEEVSKLEKLLEISDKKAQQTEKELTACRAELNATKELYEKMIAEFKQPAASGKTVARKPKTKAEPENKQAVSQ